MVGACVALTSAGRVCGASKRAFGLFFAYVKYTSTLCFACTPILAPKALRQIRYPWFFGTNSGSVNEPLMWEVRFLLGMGGDRSIGEANLRKGLCPFYGRHASCPLLWKRYCRTLQWQCVPHRPVPIRGVSPLHGWRTAPALPPAYANSTETSFSTPSMVMRSFSGAFAPAAFWIFSSGFLSSKAERGFL